MPSTTKEETFTPAQAEAIRDAGLHSMATIRWMTSQAIANLTPKQWIYQAAPGVNHILWNVGHIASSEAHFVQMAGGSCDAVPAGYKDLFGGGTEPKPSLDAYPDPAEVVEALSRSREDLVAHFTSLTGAQLLASTEGDMMKQLCPTIAQILPFCAFHEGTHTGEILVARKGLGLGRILG